MSGDYEFDPDEIERAFEQANGYCECCGKALAWEHSRSSPGRGAWEELSLELRPRWELSESGYHASRSQRRVTPRVYKKMSATDMGT